MSFVQWIVAGVVTFVGTGLSTALVFWGLHKLKRLDFPVKEFALVFCFWWVVWFFLCVGLIKDLFGKSFGDEGNEDD